MQLEPGEHVELPVGLEDKLVGKFERSHSIGIGLPKLDGGPKPREWAKVLRDNMLAPILVVGKKTLHGRDVRHAK